MTPKQQKPIDRLMMAMDDCAIARGNACWTQGYRARREHHESADDAEAVRLRAKETSQWVRVDQVEKSFRRLALKLLREAAKTKRQKKGAKR